MWGEQPTTTFANLPIGAAFKVPWVYQMFQRTGDDIAVGLGTGETYRFYGHEAVRQDCYIVAANDSWET